MSEPSPQQYTQYSTAAPPPDAAYSYYPDQSFESVYIDPPLDQPPPVRIDWAPPPMLEEDMPPQPYPDAVWTGGYWVWQDNWVWARGRWLLPPRRDYRWVHPYYEHRGDSVIFIGGFWAGPGVSFHRPPPNIDIPLARVRPGAIRGPRPTGPEGAFVPPHGSRRAAMPPAQEPQQQRLRPPEQDRERVSPPAPAPGMRAPADVNAAPPPPMHPNDAGPGSRERFQVRPPANTMPPERLHPPRPQQQIIAPDAPQAPRDGGQEAAQRARAAQQRLSQPREPSLRPPHPQPQIEQYAPPHAPPPRVSPPPATKPPPAARPPAQNSGGDRHDEQGGQGHDKHDKQEKHE